MREKNGPLEYRYRPCASNPSGHEIRGAKGVYAFLYHTNAVDGPTTGRRFVACVNACEGRNPEALEELERAASEAVAAPGSLTMETLRAALAAWRESV